MSTTKKELNVEALCQVIAWAEQSSKTKGKITQRRLERAFPEWGFWHQGSWGARQTLVSEAEAEACKTSWCVAGQTVHQSERYQPNWEVGNTQLHNARDTQTGRTLSVSDAARRELGLTESEANMMFGGHNTIRDLKAHANEACYARRIPLMYPEVGLDR